MSKARELNFDIIDRRKELEQRETPHFRLFLMTKNFSEARILKYEISDSQKIEQSEILEVNFI